MQANIKKLRLSREKLTKRYKTKHTTAGISDAERLVYVESRMPATQAVCEKVLVANVADKDTITSMLDLGCGPGSATYAATKVFHKLTTLHLINQDPNYNYDFKQPHKFFAQDFKQLTLTQMYDLVVISYALNECSSGLLLDVVSKSWEHTNKYLVIIEPGTTYGYAAFLTARQHLINQGAFIIAPCPHESACPLIKPDWCHFKLRVQRSKIHQQIKQGSRSFEDESYTFGVFARQKLAKQNKWIIKRPIHKKGHIILDCCTVNGLQREIISHKDKVNYLHAKKLEWGDDYNSNWR